MTGILIIDDDAISRTIVRTVLEKHAYAVTEADNGKAGLQLHRQEGFRLIITDIIMPDMEGIETIRELRRIDSAVRIIAISGGGIQDARDYLEIARKMGADDIIEKPIDSELLLEKIRRVLEQ